MIQKGTLYLCPTPIGNLEDITLRALKILKEVDFIAAEDTRVTIKLLNHFDIKTPLLSYHEHNKKTSGAKIVSMLKEGKDIAVVSDAGTPGFSDPGEDLVKQALKVGIRVVPLPGAVAAITALIASGLNCERFVFEGFLPKKNRDKKARIKKLSKEERTIILYEAPHRIIRTLKNLKEALGNRKIVIAREITKLHEEFIRGKIETVIENFNTKPPRGEMVVLIDGCDKSQNDTSDKMVHENNAQLLKLRVKLLTEKGYDNKVALKKAAKELGLSRNAAYEILINKSNF